MPIHARLTLAAVALAAALTIAPGAHAADAGTVMIYNGQDEGPVEAAAAAFEAKTGIKVEMRTGGSPAFANQIIQEGDHSPADVFYSEYSSPLAVLKQKGLLAPVPPATLAEVPARFSDGDGTWLGVTARTQVLVYNKSAIDEAHLPASVLDFAKPAWAGKVAYNPQSAAFLEQLTAVALATSDATAETWLEGLKQNAKAYPSNTAMIVAVERGEVPVAIVGNNYWFAVAAERDEANMASRIHYGDHDDPGAQITVSGAAILKSAPHKAAAESFLAFLVSPEGQTVIAKAAADYPLRPGIASPYDVKPLASLDPSPITPSQVGTAQTGLDLERAAGLH